MKVSSEAIKGGPDQLYIDCNLHSWLGLACWDQRAAGGQRSTSSSLAPRSSMHVAVGSVVLVALDFPHADECGN